MKKILTAFSILLSVNAFAETSPVQTITPGTGTSGLNLKTYTETYVNPRLEVIEGNRQDHESRVDTLEGKTSNINNTSDASKPISTATQTALDLKANKASTVMLWSEWANGASFTTSSPPVAYNGALYKCIAPYTKSAGEYPDTQTEYFAEVTGSGGNVDLSNYLSKTNTTAFTPSADYHPATKKYVDDAVTAGGGYTDEQAQDAVGGMFSGNTETGITVTYNDTTGKVDFVVATQSDVNFTSALNTKLAGIATGAEVNVNADWNSVSGDSQILNKPTIPTISDTAYGVSWNGDTGAASKNAIYDKIETIAGGTLPSGTEGQTIQYGSGGTPAAVDLTELTPTAMSWTSQSAFETWLGWTFSGSSFPYPGAGIPLSTGSAWSTSLTLDTDLSSVSSNDDSVPSAKAVKTALSAAGGLTSTLPSAPYSDIACTKDGVYNHTLYKCVDAGSGTGYYTEYIASTAYSNPAPVFYTLSVTDPGNNDAIYSNDSDLSAIINCGNGNTACSASIASGSVISGITAIPSSGRAFVAWTGDVTGLTASDGTVTMTSAKSCGATFEVYDACSNTAFDSEATVGVSSFSTGYSTTVYSTGVVKISTGTQSICSIDAYVQRIGTMTGKNVVIERWSTNSSTGALVAKQEGVVSIEASTVSTTAGWMNIPFGKEVVLSQYDAIVVLVDGEVSATNYLRWYYQGTGTMANYRGRGWSDAGVAAATGSGTDMNVKLYAPN
jgi:hypothetical protein